MALYAEICEVFLGKRQEARGIIQELTAAQKQQALQPLAYALMQRGVREITREEAVQIIAPQLALVSPQMQPEVFVQTVENTSGVLLERNPGIYGFAHLTFQEYLAAVHIEKEKDEQLLVAHVEDSWWHETIRLYCAQADATALIAACLKGNPPAISALTLAAECQQEALKIQPEVRIQLETLLEQGVEDVDPERRHLVAEVLLARRIRDMVPVSETIYRDTTLMTSAEYQLFLDERLTQNTFCQPDHWRTAVFPPGRGRMPVLGVRQADAMAFCQWLRQRDSGVWHYRLPKKSECTRKEAEEKQSEEMGYWTQQEREFVWLKQPPFSLWRKIEPLYFRDYSLLLVYMIIATLDGASARALSSARASALARAFARALVLARALASNLDNDLTRARDRDLARDLASAHALALDSARARDLDSARAFALDSDLATILKDNILKASDRSQTIEVTKANKNSHNQDKQAEFLRLDIRYSILALVLLLNVQLQQRSSSQIWVTRLFTRKKSQFQEDDDVEQMYENLLSLYRDFALLELRIQEKLPAWEGILLVKERHRSTGET